mmetsp:Transcript_14193/g.22494  ORF Transcript_14193/g.22494 Transcript_14193/m.22494 type:complete len:148 (-) Transcript_14193:13-456(-)
MCDCEAQERKIAAIRKQNAKSDAKFNVQFVEKFKRTINLLPGVRELAVEKESKVMDDGDESDLGSDEEDDDDILKKIIAERKQKIGLEIEKRKEQTALKHKMRYKDLSLEKLIAKYLRSKGAKLVLFHGTNKASTDVVHHIRTFSTR